MLKAAAGAVVKGEVRDSALEMGLGAGVPAVMAEQLREKMARITTIKDTCTVLPFF